jgi:hypothetical protein
MRFLLAFCGLAILARLAPMPVPAIAAESWPPSDPGEPKAQTELDAGFAARVRNVKSFAELQHAAGAQGRIIEVVPGGDAPHVVYSWSGSGRGGSMRALVYRDGAFGAIITPAGGANDITLNSFGAFICPSCSPPANSCGLRPSWVPHDLHWDVFDCSCTLTGPQQLNGRPC